VTEPDPKALDEMFNRVLRTEDDALTAARERGAAAGMPAIEVSAQHGKLLFLLATAMRASRVLEIGTLAGYSTIQLARGVGAGGRVVTLEYEPAHAEVARQNLARAGVDDRVEVIVGAALDTLPTLLEGEPFDLIFIDADKPSTADYFEWALKLSRPGSLIVVDNVVRKGAVADPASDDPNVQGVRRFYDRLAAEPRVAATAIQTVGSKGYDGLAIALVTAGP
jgi:predicted O-methyltransferase YrrM